MKTNNHQPLLSKSKYMKGLQCHKLLWYCYNRKEEIPPVDPATQAIFDQGTQVGLLAQQLFPGGIKLERNASPQKHAKQSISALSARKPLFEAGFIAGNGYALADILNPVQDGAWDLIEVKSSTEVKDEHYPDVAFQKHVYEGAGLKIRRCHLMHINNQYVRQGSIDPAQLFTTVDITDSVEREQPSITEAVEKMLAVIGQGKAPDIKIGPQCDEPHECSLKEVCWKFVPEEDSVFVLSRGKKLAFSLLDRNILMLTAIPAGTKLTDNQRIQVGVHQSGTPYVDRAAVKQFLDGLGYPLYFLDFETIDPTIPLFDSSRPFEKIVFQYSLFVVQKRGATPRHHAFLFKGKTDPREEILKQLKGLLGEKGSIVAYNASFEVGALKGACGVFPQYQGWVDDLKARFVDLYVPFRSFDYYHPDQQGSASIKAVLPALTGKAYAGLDITDGAMASREYFRVTFSDHVPEEERQRIYAGLEKYCDLDTQGMMDIVEKLGDI